MIMTIEEFAHRCLLIKAGNVTLSIPCCANCEHYEKNEFDHWACMRHRHFRIFNEPEDFCSKFEERNN